MNLKKLKVFLICIATIGVALSLPFVISCSSTSNAAVDDAAPKNIIFMVPDGMGLSNVTIARTYKNGLDGASLSFETLPYIGYQRTFSKSTAVTDSAAAASAWASGEKFNNGEISCHDEDDDGQCDGSRINPETILELAQGLWMATGLVATSDITHATPAAWGAHTYRRDCQSEIFEQFLDLEIDVLLGAGIGLNDPDKCSLLGETDEDYNAELVEVAVGQSYHYITTTEELMAAGGEAKLLGLFKEEGTGIFGGGLTPMYKRGADNIEPTLAEMTTVALDILEENENGFFLMVEGSQVDWANHLRNTPMMIKEVLAFDDAVAAVRNWIDADPDRQENTLLIIVADHETGGVIINGSQTVLNESGDSDEQAEAMDDSAPGPATPVFDDDGNPVMDPNQEVRHTSTYYKFEGSGLPISYHTGVDTIIWSNSPEFAKAMDNTDLFEIMKSFIMDF